MMAKSQTNDSINFKHLQLMNERKLNFNNNLNTVK